MLPGPGAWIEAVRYKVPENESYTIIDGSNVQAN